MSRPTAFPVGAMTPGPESCARLASVEVDALPDEQLLEVLSAEWRQLAYQQARVWAVLAELATRAPGNLPGAEAWSPEQVFESAVDEVRAELRLTRRAARRELEHADAVAGLPPVAAALRRGDIDRARAVVLADGCWDLTSEQAARLLAEVLPDAGRVTATGLAERVRRVAIALDPAWAERRYREAVRSRRVIGYLNDDGSATVSGQHLPADQAAAACARVDALAAAAKRAGAAAPIDHLRAELFLGLLDGRFSHAAQAKIVARLVTQFPRAGEATEEPAEAPAAPTATPTVTPTAAPAATGVEVRVGLGTLLGLDEQPGEIAGWGPVPATVAREVAARQPDGEWRFAVVDTAGRLLFDGLTRRRPRDHEGDLGAARGGVVELQVPVALLTDLQLPMEHPAWRRVIADLAEQYAERRPITQDPAARFAGRRLRRHTQIEHRTCLFPGCRRPARECDLDHRAEHARGGPTTKDNLGPGCRHDHGLKSTGGWRLIKKSGTTYVWISPLGRRHLVRVDPVAAPLPGPRPRPLPPEPPPNPEPDPPPRPSFARPSTSEGRLRAGPQIPDPDPPPY